MCVKLLYFPDGREHVLCPQILPPLSCVLWSHKKSLFPTSIFRAKKRRGTKERHDLCGFSIHCLFSVEDTNPLSSPLAGSVVNI